MTGDELRAKFGVAYKIIMRERNMRDRVFPAGHPKRDEKLAEIDRLLEIVQEFKNELKVRVGDDYEQPTLLDAPRKAGYG